METKNKELIETLTRGRDSAKKLQNLLHHKLNNNDDHELVSADDLVTEISQSFCGSLLVLNSSNSGELGRVAPVVTAGHLNSAGSGDVQLIPKPAVKGRRGCYKRRKTMDTRMEVSGTIEDGYAWRKYGQKNILNSDFPRCYFRCAHRQLHGCKATKQVQKLEDGSNMFHILYFDHHTCPPPNTYSHTLDHLDSKNSPNSPSTIANNHIDPSLCNTVTSVTGTSQSSSALVWKEILLDEFEYFKEDGRSLSDMSLDDITFS